MKTLQVKGGDIRLGFGGYAIITGEEKLKQDLALALIEEVNTDRFHPRWGSMLAAYIGAPSVPETRAVIQGEVSRIVSNYISRQQREIQEDSLSQKKSRFTDAEVIVKINSIAISQSFDRIFVRISLTTRAQGQVVVVQGIGG